MFRDLFTVPFTRDELDGCLEGKHEVAMDAHFKRIFAKNGLPYEPAYMRPVSAAPPVSVSDLKLGSTLDY